MHFENGVENKTYLKLHWISTFLKVTEILINKDGNNVYKNHLHL